MIRLVVVDDQTLVRSGIRQLLDTVAEIDVVAEAASAEEALRVIGDAGPDVVLLDVRMPGGSGIEVLKTLNGAGSLPPTILLTTFDDDDVLLDGLRHGAKGFLLKDISLDRLVDAIRQVASGGSLVRPAITERVAAGVRDIGLDFECLGQPDQLTPREIELLRLMAGGLSNREIAAASGTAEGTVKNQVSSILSKLGVRDRVRAVLKGIEAGYI
ncbi:response regulator [Paraburkholderia solisilvae]|uniref:Transcriptional regulatory protein LnrK n=1 Tax=Paraburkholderia solisilvae TaxID=624376 RepID=A0A6J5EZT6_9BURK|nr:response regulator transcription factor [Paraburkholderia solisilvae]CAB3771673.1 Transcriptional regulatory protein LnrK [Paraburkholderia solisilvae]